MDEIERHIFNGTSTDCSVFGKWMNGEKFVRPMLSTRDKRELRVGNEWVQSGDAVALMEDGSFTIVKND